MKKVGGFCVNKHLFMFVFAAVFFTLSTVTVFGLTPLNYGTCCTPTNTCISGTSCSAGGLDYLGSGDCLIGVSGCASSQTGYGYSCTGAVNTNIAGCFASGAIISNSHTVSPSDCASGKTCFVCDAGFLYSGDGCISTCSDSDYAAAPTAGGQAPGIFGTVSGTQGLGVSYSHSDSCISATTLHEYYCSPAGPGTNANSVWKSYDYTCGGNTYCNSATNICDCPAHTTWNDTQNKCVCNSSWSNADGSWANGCEAQCGDNLHQSTELCDGTSFQWPYDSNTACTGVVTASNYAGPGTFSTSFSSNLRCYSDCQHYTCSICGNGVVEPEEVCDSGSYVTCKSAGYLNPATITNPDPTDPTLQIAYCAAGCKAYDYIQYCGKCTTNAQCVPLFGAGATCNANGTCSPLNCGTLTNCNGVCVNTATNLTNCGSCGNACTTPQPSCTSSSTRTTYADPVCTSGSCSYTPTSTVCSSLAPPVANCTSSTTKITYGMSGYCSGGICTLRKADTVCAQRNAVCYDTATIIDYSSTSCTNNDCSSAYPQACPANPAEPICQPGVCTTNNGVASCAYSKAANGTACTGGTCQGGICTPIAPDLCQTDCTKCADSGKCASSTYGCWWTSNNCCPNGWKWDVATSSCKQAAVCSTTSGSYCTIGGSSYYIDANCLKTNTQMACCSVTYGSATSDWLPYTQY